MGRFGSGKKKAKGKKQSGGKKKPVVSVREGNIDIALWKNPKGYSISINKSYGNEDDGYQNMKITLFPSEMGRLDEALTKFSEDEKVQELFEDEDDSADDELPEPHADSDSEKSSEIVLEIIADHSDEKLKGYGKPACAYETLQEEYDGSLSSLEDAVDRLLDTKAVEEPVLGYLRVPDRGRELKQMDDGQRLFDTLPQDKQENLLSNSKKYTKKMLATGIFEGTDLTQPEAEAVAVWLKAVEKDES